MDSLGAVAEGIKSYNSFPSSDCKGSRQSGGRCAPAGATVRDSDGVTCLGSGRG